MSFEPRVTLRPDEYDDGVPAMPRVIARFLPDVAEVRGRFNEQLAGGAVDARLKELIRLYNASFVNCAYCKNVRYGVDGTQVVAEEEVASARDFENADIDDRTRAALRLARAFFLDPAHVDDELRAELDRHFTGEQIVELVLTMVRCRAGSKTLITLGFEPRDMPVRVI